MIFNEVFSIYLQLFVYFSDSSPNNGPELDMEDSNTNLYPEQNSQPEKQPGEYFYRFFGSE